ncbi:MAG TPA: LLM class flavin-dependent oxidoreductase [Solirubrobacterales bacterium]|nr:LLM class flavin-dependent oxidoreductase [Solirubrobacterales bacterium]
MLLSFQMLPEQPAAELLEAIAIADELGYYGCYSADEIYHKDGWLLFAAAAQSTSRIRLGPCVAPIYMRDPTYVAQLAATLDELGAGRAEVVFGIGNIAMLEQYGIEWQGTRPIARLREAHQVMRTLLDEGSIDFAGDFYSYSGVTTAARPVQEHLPLKIGAMGGPRSMQLAGEIADGLHAACAYSPEALGYVVEQFRAGAERSRRDPGELDLGDSLLGAIAPDRDVARRAGRILAAFYIPSMPPALLERHEIDPERVAPIGTAFAAGDVQRALELTPEEVADRIMVAGTAEDWVEWLGETYAPAGFDHALVSFTDPFTLRAWAGIELDGLPSLGEQVRMVGEQVLPALAAT